MDPTARETGPTRLPWRRAERARDSLRQATALTDQFEELQSAAADLVSSDDPRAVLGRIAGRAASAVGGQRHLLVMRPNDGRPSEVVSNGFRHDEAHLAAADLLATGHVPGITSQVVAEVASARRSYGYLAAFRSEDGGFFPDASRLLAVYARHAAAALDVASALEDSRRREQTASALLALGRALSDVATPDEMAERLADAVAPVIGCDRVAVLLWDPDERTERVAGISGWPAEHQAAIRAVVVTPDAPELAQMLADPRARSYDVDRTDGHVRALLEGFGLATMIAVPLQSRGEFLGAIVALWTPERRDDTTSALDERVAGLADQAATAIENGRLLEQVQHQAMHDALTGLPNRLLLDDRLDQMIRLAQRAGRQVNVLFLDLDRFKKVNDSLGHTVGNDLLCQVADRLTTTLRGADTVARLGGDEFVIAIPGEKAHTDVSRVAERILAVFRRPYLVGGREVFITPSIGIATYPSDGATPESLIKRADAAMYRAKADGRATWRTSSEELDAIAMHRLSLEADLHKAIERGELRVHYQPIVDVTTRAVRGVEALVRWQHPELGFVGPDRFIPIAEESGLIIAIDYWVLFTACREVAAWNASLGQPVQVSVNASARTLGDASFANTVRSALRESGLAPDALELELTERAALHDDEQVVAMLRSLRRSGVRVAVDDFGTGYSMLCRLRTFPLDTLKIDRSFVQDARPDDGSPLLEGMVLMGHGLGLNVVAEGIETEEQLAAVAGRGCDHAQGYLLGRPAEAAVVFEALRATPTRWCPAAST